MRFSELIAYGFFLFINHLSTSKNKWLSFPSTMQAYIVPTPPAFLLEQRSILVPYQSYIFAVFPDKGNWNQTAFLAELCYYININFIHAATSAASYPSVQTGSESANAHNTRPIFPKWQSGSFLSVCVG